MIELEENCKQFINLIDLHLLPKAKDDESKVFYYKMNGDYFQRIAEGVEGTLKKKKTEEARNSYDNVLKYSKQLKIVTPIRLGLLLNLSLFYNAILKETKKAIEIAKNTLKESEKELKNIMNMKMMKKRKFIYCFSN